MDDKIVIKLLRDSISRGARFKSVVKGESMSPFIRDGDMVVISPVQGGSIRVGMVAAFAANGTEQLVIHRVIGIKGTGYMLKGDNSYVADGCIPAGDILGVVSCIVRNNREASLGLGAAGAAAAALNRINFFPFLFRVLRLILP